MFVINRMVQNSITVAVRYRDSGTLLQKLSDNARGTNDGGHHQRCLVRITAASVDVGRSSHTLNGAAGFAQSGWHVGEGIDSYYALVNLFYV